MSQRNASLLEDYVSCGIIKFGDFTLKTGEKSNIYFDFRILVSLPLLLKKTSNAIWSKIQELEVDKQFNTICGVPYASLPIATCVSLKTKIPMILRRKEQKEHGTGKILEGIYDKNTKCLIIEDVVTSGSSVIETAEILRKHSISVPYAIAILDREQGGKYNIAQKGIHFINLFTKSDFLCAAQQLREIPTDSIGKFNTNFTDLTQTDNSMSFVNRRASMSNSTSARIMDIMIKKRTNICVAIDFTSGVDVLEIAEKVGPYVCAVKIHSDIIENFNDSFANSLIRTATKYEFLIFEDRKFSDIGNTASLQFHKGIHKISRFADIITAHVISGESIIDGLKHNYTDVVPKCHACLLVAQMSCDGNLLMDCHIDASLEIARKHTDFVIGFVCQQKIDFSGNFLHFMPGVSLDTKSDLLGQKYKTPQEAIENGADIIIVGRSISKAVDPAAEAKRYNESINKDFFL
ncbi:hypothetical protein HZS_1684 [Henneguya salminicola]|nr:hypothetical protein HZS_1684 [Henneguya salminicola]